MAFSFGAEGMQLYLNGNRVDTNPYTGGTGTTSGGAGNFEPIAIGANTWVSGDLTVTPLVEYFDGRIDEVAIFGTQLSATDINRLSGGATQNYTLDEDASVSVPASEGVLVNDFDDDGDALTATLVSGPSNAASFTFNPDGSFDYTPLTNFNGTDTFTYRANDGSNDSNIATVTITVNPIDDPPLISDASTSVAEDAVNSTPVFNVNDTNTGNDTDVDNDAITYAITAGNTDGIFGIDVNTGQITVVDNTNLDFETTTQYVLTVNATDGSLNDTADITIDITNVNDVAPLINDATAPTLPENSANGTNVYNVNDANTSNDTDLEGDAITYAITAGNTDGIFSIDVNTGQITVVDNTNLDFETTTQYVLTVNATDGSLNDTADITIDITDINDTPPPGGTGNTGGGNDSGGNDSGGNDSGAPDGRTPDPIEPPPVVVDDPPGIPPEGDWPFSPPIIVDDNPDSVETVDNNPQRKSETPTEFTLDLDSTPITSDGEAANPNPLTPVVDQEVFVKHLNKTVANLRESQPEPSDGFDSVVTKLEHFAQAAPLLPPLELSGKLLDLIDVMKQEMSEANLSDEQFLLVVGALGTTLTLTVGYVAWLLRIGYLATSLLSLTPMLIREFDPLLVLAKRRRKKQGEADSRHDLTGDKDAAVDRLFDRNVYPKIDRNQLSKPS